VLARLVETLEMTD
jgi:hypothetical protein